MARLPIPGGDSGEWGNVLTDFLSVEHNADGTLKHPGLTKTEADGFYGPTVIMGNYTKRAENYESLAAAIADLPNGGADGGEIQVDGDLVLPQSYAIPGKVWLTGKGHGVTRLLAPASTDYGDNLPLLSFIGADGAALHGVTLDGDGDNRFANRLSRFITINNVDGVTIDGVRFMGGGVNDTSSPGGPYIELIAMDALSDFDTTPGAVVGSVTNCRITNNIFEQRNGGGFGFAIRLKTNWSEQRNPGSFVHHVAHNHIAGNIFLAAPNGEGFHWNTVELAGGGTHSNVVERNTFWGTTLSHIDFDKGAHDNIAIFNTVESAGRPDRYLSNSSTRCATLHVHGNAGYRTNRNTVAYNTVRNVVNTGDSDPYQAAITVEYAEDTVVERNTIDGVQGDTASRGRAVHLGYETIRAQIVGNTIRNAPYGIRTNNQDTNRSGLVIRGNDIDVPYEAIFAGTLASGTATIGSVHVQDNVVRGGANATYAVTIDGGDGMRAVVSGNSIATGGTAMRVNIPNALVVGNHLRGSTAGVRSYRADSRFIGNIASGSTPFIMQGGVVPYQTENSWQTVPGSIGSSTTITGADAFVPVNSAGGALTITLPDAGAARSPITIKRQTADTNTITVAGQPGQPIDGEASVTITTSYGFLTVQSNGSGLWYVTGKG